MTAAKAPAKKRGLGRGLTALLGNHDAAVAKVDVEQPQPGDRLERLPVSQLQAGKYQPRQQMREDALDELANSIRAQGVIQPIVVRAIGKDKYEIVAGERRWRASQRAGIDDIPVVIRELDDRAAIAMALIENIQREDLNPLEEAQALQRLIDEFDLTHALAAEAVGRSRASVSNLLRLLDLPPAIRALLESRQLEMGHARALLTLSSELASRLASEAAQHGWSVREVEARAQQYAAGKVPSDTAARAAKSSIANPDVATLERELSDSLGSRVTVKQGPKGRGKLVIDYGSLDALDGILERLRK
ncbi:ParB/RepB/Spo0J family partition protein [Solilutibacter silvestris]|uniref:Probable chromosome-partitioning protein ParB n=1 Tax=Solilutibacter silvestris TaxID=1645665 RepID=A0A2K1Q0P0_9GAMM|nr:ParB/RepB/Spo0J family partition protein [Lysobacter silvestris]PNS08608.1 ParB/RepB/Spo0J protein [Lysobacter silvestris]